MLSVEQRIRSMPRHGLVMRVLCVLFVACSPSVLRFASNPRKRWRASTHHLRIAMMRDPADPPFLQLSPAALSIGDEAPESVDEPSTAICVTFVSMEGATCVLRCQRHATLRSLQRPLCSAFCKNYPYDAANLIVGGQAFSDFDDVPLLTASDYDCANVVFTKQLSDPHGYDQIARKRGNHITLEEDRYTYTRT